MTTDDNTATHHAAHANPTHVPVFDEGGVPLPEARIPHQHRLPVQLAVKVEWVIHPAAVQLLMRSIPVAVAGWAEVLYTSNESGRIQTHVLKERTILNNRSGGRHIISPSRLVGGLATVVGNTGNKFTDESSRRIVWAVRLSQFGTLFQDTMDAAALNVVVQAALFGEVKFR